MNYTSYILHQIFSQQLKLCEDKNWNQIRRTSDGLALYNFCATEFY